MPCVFVHPTAYEHWVVSSLVTNGATVKILTHGSVKRVLSLLPRKAFLGNKVFLCSVFTDLANQFYKMVVTIYNLTSSI